MEVFEPCPLCESASVYHFAEDKRRPYLRCEVCALVFVPSGFHLSAALEKAEYDLHQNRVDDAGYRGFLSRLAEPMLARLQPASRGLDFGCGPGPALAAMLGEAGHPISLYDPFYFADRDVLGRTYQFVTATEVLEHLHHPGAELDLLWSMLEPLGWLGVMTKLVIDAQAFEKWHYKNDPTHVCFFSRETFSWWASRYEAELEFVGSDVIFLRRG